MSQRDLMLRGARAESKEPSKDLAFACAGLSIGFQTVARKLALKCLAAMAVATTVTERRQDGERCLVYVQCKRSIVWELKASVSAFQ